MYCNIVSKHISVPNLINRQTQHFSADLKIQYRFIFLQFLSSTVKDRTEFFFLDRLHQIVECSYLVALRDIVGVARDEHDLNNIVVLAKLLRHRHTVHITHFNIQEQNIVVTFLSIVE